MKAYKILAFLVFFCLADGYWAQPITNSREKTILFTGDTAHLDTLSIIPGSILLKTKSGLQLDSSFYSLIPDKSTIRLNQQKLKLAGIEINDSLTIEYRTFPYFFSKSLQHKSIKNIQPDASGRIDPFSYSVEKTKEDPFKTEGLNKNGSISRGINFGNNQDVVVNSNLNLQLSGKLSNNIDLQLAATDNNIPIQPDGNTQQLQDFDKVFIQLSDGRSKLIAGDFQLYRPGTYFMNFNKKAQGLSFSTILNKPLVDEKPNPKGIFTTSASAAVSRGKFARNTIAGVEGNQGPYRLRGAENELFIIILSGTEKVFMDGVLLKRGQENDYVIDYNTAEIIFTPKQFITKDKRIAVEFQYSDKNYARSLIYFGNEYRNDKLKVGIHVYSEQDNKNQPLQQDLTIEQKKLLVDIGDSLSKAITPGIDSVAFNGSEVLYLKKDTTIGTQTFNSIFLYSTDPAKSFFRLTFSNVGAGNGNYTQVNSSANGRVFAWVMPDTLTGRPMGSYEPVLLLITPKKKQMLVANTEYKISKNTLLLVESAISNNDQNTFSKFNSGDDVGYALKFALNNTLDLQKVDSTAEKKVSPWKLRSGLNYEYTQKYFSTIERFRSVEFERDWNRPSTTELSDQHITGVQASLFKSNNHLLGYQLNSFVEGSKYNGIKQNANYNLNTKSFSVRFDGSLLNTKTTLNHTDFLRHRASLTKKFNWFNIGVRDLQEKNRFREKNTDTLQANSYSFYEWEVFVNNGDTLKNKFELSYKQRTDMEEKNNALKKSTFAESVAFSLGILKNPNSQFSTRITYRKLTILDSLLTIQKPDESMVGRIERSNQFAKGFVQSSTFYEVGSGLELKKEFSFIEVAPGQGSYTWTDYNANGVKELNEFEIAAFSDQAKYIKVFIPTNSYLKTYTTQFSHLLNLRPAALWSTKKGFKKAVSLFSNQVAYLVDRKVTTSDPEVVFNPLYKRTLDSTLVTLNSSIRNTLFFNQNSAVFGIDISLQDARNKSLLVNGLESRENIFRETRARWNITRIWSTLITLREGRKSNHSEYFISRDYHINYKEAEPKLSYQPNTSFRTTVSFRYSEKNNHSDFGGQRAIIQDYGTELKYNILTKGSINLKANYIRIAYNDLSNTAIAYEMLESLKTGENYTWGLSYQRTLTNNMQINITYDGRQSAGNKAIHTGGAQVRAFF